MRIEGRGAEAGFTLIETIVALAILSTVLVAFFAFLSSALNGAHRIAMASVAYDHRTNALELATAVNPMATPRGALDLGGYRIRWTSELLGKVEQSSGYPVGSGIFQVALYRMVFTFPDDPEVPSIGVTKLGYRRDDVPGMTGAGALGTAGNGGGQ